MEQFANNAATNLASAITNSATSLTVNNGSVFPSSGNFRIIVANEIMLVTAVSGNTLTVTRGQESTTAQAQSAGAAVTQILTAGAINAFRSDNITASGVASLPSAGTAGRLYLTTDDDYIYQDNGSAWTAFGPVFKLTPPPAVASFTWVNQDGATATQSTNGSIVIAKTSTSAGNNASYLFLTSSPVAPYTLTCYIRGVCNPNVQNPNIVLAFRDSGTGKLHNYGLNADTTKGPFLFSNTFSNPTTFNAQYLNNLFGQVSFNGLWLRIADDNTNRISSLSNDGVTFFAAHTVTRTDYFTANQIGFGVNPSGTSAFASIQMLSWKVT